MSLTHEPHYTPMELGERWNLSPQMIRKIFEREPGVLKLGEPSPKVGKKLKRTYSTLRIPYSVAERVHQQRSTKSRSRV